jgi:hypothetical protein
MEWLLSGGHVRNERGEEIYTLGTRADFWKYQRRRRPLPAINGTTKPFD